MEALQVAQVFVPHVKAGYEDRRESIERQLGERGIPFRFVLDGDIPDLTPERLRRFAGHMLEPDMRPAVSCALKHLLIYEEMALGGLPDALVLEDDIQLAPQFMEVFNRSLVEAKTTLPGGPQLFSYENSGLWFVPGRERKAGRLLYPADFARCAGAYYINQAAALEILEHVKAERLAIPIDHYHTQLCRAGTLSIHWCHPPIAEQGSMNGQFDSAISDRRRQGLGRRFRWSLDKLYKQLLSHWR